MKEKPIIFTSEMVRAILDGKKTQTRRPIKNLEKFSISGNGKLWAYQAFFTKPVNGVLARHAGGFCCENEAKANFIERFCKYKVGDRLWVRETFLPDPPHDGTWCYYEYSDGVLHNYKAIPERFQNPNHVIYNATWDGSDLLWKPSIFMPRWASRITLEVTDIRVERIQEITEVDAIAEGVSVIPRWNNDCYGETHIEAVRRLWSKMYDKKEFSWNQNPFVWVVGFKVVEL